MYECNDEDIVTKILSKKSFRIGSTCLAFVQYLSDKLESTNARY